MAALPDESQKSGILQRALRMFTRGGGGGVNVYIQVLLPQSVTLEEKTWPRGQQMFTSRFYCLSV